MIQATEYVIHQSNATTNPSSEVWARNPPETFLDAVKLGKAKLIEIDDWVERWHTGADGQNLELREYLGFSRELYASWVRNGPDALMGLMK